MSIRIAMYTIALVLQARVNAAEVAPPPRLVGQPMANASEKTLDRIIRKAREVGDRLEKLDPGSDTRVTQGDILRDIESLIREQETPPQSSPPPQPDQKPKNDKSEKEPGGSPPMPKPENSPKGSSPGLPSESQEPSPPPPRAQRNRGQPGPKNSPSPMPEPLAGKAKEPLPKLGGPTPGSAVGSKVTPKPLMPLEGDVEKDVWGHLPEQLRKQVSSYYRQEFMPQYAELLRQYYASLAEREGKR